MIGGAALQPSATNEHSASCRQCGGLGCDVRVLDCGCSLHARCCPMNPSSVPLVTCPCCNQATRGLYLLPMSFDELDEARRVAASASSSATGKRGQKRKNATIARLNPQASSSTALDDSSGENDLRTGRWTAEEMAFCDKLVEKFQNGQLPLLDGTKLNDFLSKMLKSKQSRLTKKMKNAKLSAKTFCRTTGYIHDQAEARQFTMAEGAFFNSILCSMERAEIRFHMQKEWRELFSSYCLNVGQPLDADKWLSSVEEMDRRMSRAKDAARMARRKIMMGHALSQDSLNPDQGVFIERTDMPSLANEVEAPGEAEEIIKLLQETGKKGTKDVARKGAYRMQAGPFLSRMIAYMQRHAVPFEHVDAWVPSFVPVQTGGESSKCRLCYAGCATTDVQVGADGNVVPISSEDRFDWLAFGEYSQKFSFDVGCGLPGRVYQHGVPSWEQNVENAPHQHFERCGGAAQWGIKTVVAIPIPSPSVGRVVVVLYSCIDRTQDQEMVTRLAEELTKLVPSPKWKLVVDVGSAPAAKTTGHLDLSSVKEDHRVSEALAVINEHMPSNSSSPLVSFLPGFTSLRLLLTKTNRTPKENEVLGTLLGSYSSYVSSGKPSSEIAWLLARDCMHLASQQSVQKVQPAAQPTSQASVPSATTRQTQQASGAGSLDPLYQIQPQQLPPQPQQGVQQQQLPPPQQLPHQGSIQPIAPQPTQSLGMALQGMPSASVAAQNPLLTMALQAAIQQQPSAATAAPPPAQQLTPATLLNQPPLQGMPPAPPQKDGQNGASNGLVGKR